MFTPYILLILLGIFQIATATPLKQPTRSFQLSSNDTLLTNAERFKRGLPPNVPTRLHDSTRKRDPLPSTIGSAQKGYLKFFDNDNNYFSYGSIDDSNGFGIFKMTNAAGASLFEYSDQGNPGELRAGSKYLGIFFSPQQYGKYGVKGISTSDNGNPKTSSQSIKTSVYTYDGIPAQITLTYSDSSTPNTPIKIWFQPGNRKVNPVLNNVQPVYNVNGAWAEMTVWLVNDAGDNSDPLH